MGRRPRLSFPSARSGSRRPLDYAESLSRHLHAATGAKKITRHDPGLGIMAQAMERVQPVEPGLDLPLSPRELDAPLRDPDTGLRTQERVAGSRPFAACALV